MAPRIAARQYIAYRDLGVPVKITFKCEGNVDADIGDFVIYPIPGMPSILGVPGGFQGKWRSCRATPGMTIFEDQAAFSPTDVASRSSMNAPISETSMCLRSSSSTDN